MEGQGSLLGGLYCCRRNTGRETPIGQGEGRKEVRVRKEGVKVRRERVRLKASTNQHIFLLVAKG